MKSTLISFPHLTTDYIKLLAPKILQHQKPFVMDDRRISKKCRDDSGKFLTSLKKFDLWALKSERLSFMRWTL